MPNFEARITAGATIETWDDPEGSQGQPSRVNPQPGYPHKRYVGVVGTEVAIDLYVGGAVLPDSGLGGHLFYPWTVEAPHPYPIGFSHDPTWSSKPRFTPGVPGHYCIGIRRPFSGPVLMHIDVEAA